MGYKDDQLGMSFGTARYRLQRSLLWKYIQMAGHDACYQCGEPIENESRLSIEHKQPWLHVSADLFWDLDNIAFSHMSCNVAAARPSGQFQRRVGPDGTAWCIGHQQFLPVADFGRHDGRWNGYHFYCRACRRKDGPAPANGARDRR